MRRIGQLMMKVTTTSKAATKRKMRQRRWQQHGRGEKRRRRSGSRSTAEATRTSSIHHRPSSPPTMRARPRLTTTARSLRSTTPTSRQRPGAGARRASRARKRQSFGEREFFLAGEETMGVDCFRALGLRQRALDSTRRCGEIARVESFVPEGKNRLMRGRAREQQLVGCRRRRRSFFFSLAF